jgi:2-amino-4-hydroxy-6-hydroxymethyldihydropteridine diphosphokinase
MIECFIALGGNIGNTFEIMNEALCRLKAINEIHDFEVSRPFITTPVSDLPQPLFLNAVARFYSTASPHALFKEFEEIERALGKEKKPKNSPRLIDIDFLFYGDFCIQEEELQLPHPRWHERLFVLIPLADLVTHAPIDKEKNLISLIAELGSKKNESVIPSERSFHLTQHFDGAFAII